MSVTGQINRSPLALVLWAVLLLFGQTAALAHQHADDPPDTSCVVCGVSKAEIAACDAAPAVAAPDASYLPAYPDAVSSLPAPQPRPYQSRAPPRA